LILSQSQSSCSHDFFHYADAASHSDGNCGCVIPGSDCTESSQLFDQSTASIYQIVEESVGVERAIGKTQVGHAAEKELAVANAGCGTPKKGICTDVSDPVGGKQSILIWNHWDSFSKDDCFNFCAKVATTDGEGCCHYGPESRYSLTSNPICKLIIGDWINTGKLSPYAQKHADALFVSECHSMYPLIAKTKRCGNDVRSAGWLNQYNLGLEGCANLILSQSQSSCSHDFFHYANAGSHSDGNCGCVTPGSDCTESSQLFDQSTVNTYQIDSATDKEFASEANQVIGTTENAVLIFAAIGAMATVYYGLKGVHKFFTANEFQKIECEC